MDEATQKKMVETIEGLNRGMNALAEMLKNSDSTPGGTVDMKALTSAIWEEHGDEILERVADHIDYSDLANEVSDHVSVESIAQYVDHEDLARNLDIDCIRESLVENLDTDKIATTLFEILVKKVVNTEVQRQLAQQKAQGTQ